MTENSKESIVMCGVDEYGEGMEVSIQSSRGMWEQDVSEKDSKGFGRDVIRAYNEGGHNATDVDLEHVLKWVADNRPEQYAKFITTEMMRLYT